MPDESCRRCGANLCECAICTQCRKPIQYICTKCGMPTPEQFHGKCFYGIELGLVEEPYIGYGR